MCRNGRPYRYKLQQSLKNINKLGKLEKSGEGYKSPLKTAMCINLLNRYLMGF